MARLEPGTAQCGNPCCNHIVQLAQIGVADCQNINIVEVFEESWRSEPLPPPCVLFQIIITEIVQVRC